MKNTNQNPDGEREAETKLNIATFEFFTDTFSIIVHAHNIENAIQIFYLQCPHDKIIAIHSSLFNQQKAKCNTCNGKGYLPYETSSDFSCLDCNGYGWIRIPTPTDPQPNAGDATNTNEVSISSTQLENTLLVECLEALELSKSKILNEPGKKSIESTIAKLKTATKR